MELGVAREPGERELRVGLTPAGVKALVQAGHTVYVETGAGAGAGFADEEYVAAGGQVVYSRDELVGRSEILIKVSPLTAHEAAALRDKQIVLSFHHLAVMPAEVIKVLLRKKVALVAYESIVQADGFRPILVPMSQIAGRMSAHVAAHYLEAPSGGRGVLLGGVPGVAPANATIIGAGIVGRNAVASFLGLGAQVTVLDTDVAKLAKLTELFPVGVITMLGTSHNIARAVEYADAVVGAVLVPGSRAPIVVTAAMVKAMRPKAVIVDVSIDQGGCVETSRPTTYLDPIFIAHGVIHYCVPNMPALVPRTSTHALSNALVPYLRLIADLGLENAMLGERALAAGVVAFEGYLSDPLLAAYFGVEWRNPLDQLQGHK